MGPLSPGVRPDGFGEPAGTGHPGAVARRSPKTVYIEEANGDAGCRCDIAADLGRPARRPCVQAAMAPGRSSAIVQATGVPLVTTSNTGENRIAISTSSRLSSALASALMSNTTRIDS